MLSVPSYKSLQHLGIWLDMDNKQSGWEWKMLAQVSRALELDFVPSWLSLLFAWHVITF